MSEDLAANDVTAIDAVTGDAANMAADVDINFTNDMLGSAGSNQSGGTRSAAAPRQRSSRPSPATEIVRRRPPSRPPTRRPTKPTKR